ncbi:acyl-CoA synthetase [Microbacterium oleivorans]|uniref:acyl-CoA synthetase n=1 Tax=Microbacterium oleivorans TaxID=273677 RepID=UPI0020421A1B|nr:acyl-CoA synthetase [Microbacterium oleivorans]MCM3694811.1 acyl-CoA synthetase [Microbacterium oleivorans]
MPDAAPRAFEVRHLQMGRALFAAIAAVMITFSGDHSAQVGGAVFSGFAVATGLILLLSAWLVFRTGERSQALLLGILTLVAGMIATLPAARTVDGFFTVVLVWALVAGAAELVIGIIGRRRGTPAAGESVFVGALTIVLGLALLFVPRGYTLDYYIDQAQQSFTLTGITIGVGVFGGYAAIVAVYLGIAAFSPRPAAVPAVETADTDAAGGRT